MNIRGEVIDLIGLRVLVLYLTLLFCSNLLRATLRHLVPRFELASVHLIFF